MSQAEFSLIRRYFSAQIGPPPDESTLLLGIGDDAAVLQPAANQNLVQTIDTLIEGTHFPADTDPVLIAYKSLAVNVSDLIAMAATPSFFLLSLTIPCPDESFVNKFATGLRQAADKFRLYLIGGDTCKGPLSITIQASGYLPDGLFVSRGGAKIGDRILVSGRLGAAAVGLASLHHRLDPEFSLSDEQREQAVGALNKPEPQLAMISLLRSYATSAIDLSDGLVGDLAHILQQSGVGAVIDKASLPVFDWIAEHDQYDFALTGGDDYKILFTVPETQLDNMLVQSRLLELDVTDIGYIVENGYILDDNSSHIDLSLQRGFDHFAA